MLDIDAQVEEWWAESEAIQRQTWTSRAKENFRFYAGDQWTVEERQALEDAGRPCRTINSILNQVNTLAGHQRQNRRDITILPRKGGNKSAADIFTALIKHTIDACNGQYEVSDWYGYGCIGSVSWLEVDIDYSVDPINGNIVVRNLSPFAVLEDQLNLNYDVNEGRFVFKSYYQDRDWLIKQYPRKKRELEVASSNPPQTTEDVGRGEDYRPDSEGDAIERTTERQVFVRECWYKTYERTYKSVQLDTGDVEDLTAGEASALKKAIELAGAVDKWQIVERVVPRLHRITRAGEITLEHTHDPFGPVTLFPLIRFVPMWVDGTALGIVDNLKDPQRVKNKTRSKAEEAISQTTNSGYKVKKLQTPEAGLKLEQMGARAGYVIDESEYGGSVEKITPNPMPEALFRMSDRADRDIPEVSGLNSDVTGTTRNPSESGIARQVRQEAGLVATEVISDNFARSCKTLGRVLLEIIRGTDVYSDEEIAAVVDDQNLKDFIEVDAAGDKTIHLDALNEWHLGEYGVTVSDSPNRPTVRQANFEQAMEMRQAGIPVPPEVLVDLSDMQDKDEIKASIREQAVAQQQMAQRQAVPA